MGDYQNLLDYLRYFTNSSVLNIFEDAFTGGSLKCGSLDQMGISSSSANARNGTSLSEESENHTL